VLWKQLKIIELVEKYSTQNVHEGLLNQKVAVMTPASLILYLENKLQLALLELQTFKDSESSE